MIFADTGYFIALLNPFDNLHARALLWSRRPRAGLHHRLRATRNSQLLFPPADRSNVHNLLRRLNADTGYEILPASSQLFKAGLQLHAARPDKEWSLTDCISFA